MTALITSLVNPKGGSGKTVAAVNLAAGIADLSYKVLLIDLDAHASASLALGLKKDSLPGLAGALIADDDIYDFIEEDRDVAIMCNAMMLVHNFKNIIIYKNYSDVIEAKKLISCGLVYRKENVT